MRGKIIDIYETEYRYDYYNGYEQTYMSDIRIASGIRAGEEGSIE